MATLESIRKRSGLLIIVIGFALGAFILTDFLSNGNNFFSDDPNIIGSVDGNSISSYQFSQELALLRNSDPSYAQQPQSALVNMVWSDWLREQVLGEKYEELGFTISSDELKANIISNPNISSNQAFLDQNGNFSVSLFDQAIGRLRDSRNDNPEGWKQWVLFEEAVKEQALTFKYNDAVEAGLYTPSAIARYEYRNQNVSSDIAFVQYPYTSVSDEEVEVTDADFKSYYEANKHKFVQDFETRDIVYVNFPIAPSAQDKEEIRQEVAELIETTYKDNPATGQKDTIVGFRDTDNDSLFVALNSGLPYRPGFWRSGELSSNIDSIIFSAEEGFIYGPYEETGGYKVTKLQEISYLPDSVKARHILFSVQSERNPQGPTREEAKAKADSIFELLKADRSLFDEMNEQFNDDQVAKNDGGDLGWFGPKRMVPQFEKYSFENKVGDIGLVETQFGFHIVEILDQEGSSKAVRVATLYREVLVTRRTENEVYDAAAAFAASISQGGDFDSIALSQGYTPRQVPDLQESSVDVLGLGPARPVVKWTYGAEGDVSEGDVNLVNNDGKAYVVTKLTSINPEGIKSLERVREEIRPQVINLAKANQVLIPRAKADMEGHSAITAMADATDQNVNIQKIRLAVGAITGIGQEQKIVGLMAGTAVGDFTGPVAGSQGVYVWQPNAITDFVDKEDYTSDASNITRQLRSRVNSQLFNAMLKKYDIVDNRLNFY